MRPLEDAVTGRASSRARSAPTECSVQPATCSGDQPAQHITFACAWTDISAHSMTRGSELAREGVFADAGDGVAVRDSSRASLLPQVGRRVQGWAAQVGRRLFAVVLLVLASTSIAQAAIDAYTFKDEAERARYTELTRELRCPKCQNQDIADSNAPIAADLRKEIYRMLGEGQSNQQIIDFMVDRYGEFVRYKPELNAHTWLLWFGPAGLLLGGVLLIGVIVVRRRGQRSEDADVLSDEERQRLAHLLDKNHE